MSDPSASPAGVMVLRLWIEPGGGLRVRATRTTDVESGRSTTAYTSSSTEVIALVEAWLRESVPGAPTDDAP